ncbi:MAG: gamma-glutamyltransferase, partial [Armatimonadetes bacterium]|nr:gamma-glutamyltransferase [Armatimonadota bacterium]
MLRAGGSALDAAVAGAAVLAVVEPNMGQLGGDAFMLIFLGSTGRVVAINANGPAPRGARPELFSSGIPATGLRSATVPGVVSGWCTAVSLYGKCTLNQILQPAIEYAADGFPVPPRLSRELERLAPLYAACPASAEIFLPDGASPRPGQVLIQRDLARSLGIIADSGADAFYRGDIARAISRYAAEDGGLLAREDLTDFRCEVQTPLSTEYRGSRINVNPLMSPGFGVLQALNIVEGFDLAGLGGGSAEAVHLLVEACRLVASDRERHVGDPRFVAVPLERLLSREHAAAQRSVIHPDRVAAEPGTDRAPEGDGGETTCLVAADGEGTVVAYIHSLFAGSGVTVPGTGILL